MIIRKFFDGPVAMPPSSVTEAYAAVKDRQVYVRASTERVDRAGEIVVQSGIDLTNYRKIPSVLLNHNAGAPVAKCVDIGLVGGNLEAVVEFPDAGKVPFSDAVFAMICEGLIGGVSIGFIPVDTVPIDKGRGARGPLKFLKSDMLEFSFTPIPCNPEARVLRTGIGAAGARKMLVARLKDAPDVERRMREVEVMKLMAAR